MAITYTTASGGQCKPCSRCGAVLPLSSYYRYKSGKHAGTYYARCKACWAAQCAAYEATHRAERAARTEAWKATNPDRYVANRKAARARRLAALHG